MRADAFDLSQVLVALMRDGSARELQWKGGPPPRVEGYNVSAPFVTGPAPHNGERHPDGDELLYVISGRMSVFLEEDGREREVEIGPGQAFVVPRGVWHRAVPKEPTQLLHITPGPGAEHRPLR